MTETVHAGMRLAMKTSLRILLAAGVFLGFLAVAGCHSYHVDTTVENRTGKPVKLLEVDYPSASFGTGLLDSGAVFPYRMQFRSSGPSKLRIQPTMTISSPSRAPRCRDAGRQAGDCVATRRQGGVPPGAHARTVENPDRCLAARLPHHALE